MTPEMLFLSWQDYESHVPNSFRKLWNNEDFSDATLATMDDQRISVHKIILASASKLFHRLFLKNSSKDILIYLKDINQRELDKLIEFIYTGQCKIEQTSLNEFLTAAKALEVEGLLGNFMIESEKVLDDVMEDAKGILAHKQEAQPELAEDTGVNRANVDTEQETIESEDFQMAESPREQLTSTKEEKEITYCKHCQYTSSAANGAQLLKRHTEAVHDGVKHQCDHCELKYAYRSDMIKHRKSVHLGVQVKYSCDLCDFQTWKKARLMSHKAIDHEKIQHACNLCDYKATSQNSLIEHQLSNHENGRFSCSKCDFTASHKGYLRKHVAKVHQCAVGF